MIPRSGWDRALIAAQCGLLALALLLLAGCAPAAPPGPESAAITPAQPTATPLPYGITDERAVVNGICFESAFDAAGRVFVLRSAEDLAWLFNSSDASGLCRRPALRGTFDFGGENGMPARTLAGLWSKGTGCAADHRIEHVLIDDVARTFTVYFRLIISGSCAYELVRPFWIGIPGYNEYDIRLIASP